MIFLKKEVSEKITPKKVLINGLIKSLVITILIYILLSNYTDFFIDLFAKIKNQEVSVLSFCMWLLPIIIIIYFSVGIFKIFVLEDKNNQKK